MAAKPYASGDPRLAADGDARPVELVPDPGAGLEIGGQLKRPLVVLIRALEVARQARHVAEQDQRFEPPRPELGGLRIVVG
jgi:hypothetical protein